MQETQFSLGGGVAQLRRDVVQVGRRRDSAGQCAVFEAKVPGSILGDVNFCFDFRLIREAVVLNTRKRSTDSTDRGRVRKGGV